ncbi:MAG: type III-A CRISPR-associated RAMP protein Csm4 [Oscillospiraceae bacterium]|nr:type III-A CRISPR-associated RAMP protein Csm4 [Oscillospiraceae bacterium]
MNYCLYKLKFDAPVHFGPSDTALSLYSSEEHFCADTLFSALCHSALSLGGAAQVETLCQWAREGTLLLSDSLLWQGERYFLPKPCWNGKFSTEVSTQERKALKALNWVPVSRFAAFTASLHGGAAYRETQQSEPGRHVEVERVRVGRQQEDAEPYYVGAFAFSEDAGLYVLAGCETEEQQSTVATLLAGLGWTGIGGKVSSGYGKFQIMEAIPLSASCTGDARWLYDRLNDQTAKHHLLLTTSLPREDEMDAVMENACCQVVRRGGFVQPGVSSNGARKKRTQYFLAAGTVLERRFSGGLFSVGDDGGVPVFRYGKPIFLGVEL